MVSFEQRRICPSDRELLEGKVGLTLPQLRRILRSHYNKKVALTSYQELSTAVQHPKESAQEYLMRLINLRQKILFTSKEDKSPVKYEHALGPREQSREHTT